MAPYQARTKGKKIPLGAGGLEDFQRINPQLIENDRQLIHQRNVKITLGILDYLRGLCDLDAGCTVHPSGNYTFIKLSNSLQCTFVVSRYYL